MTASATPEDLRAAVEWIRATFRYPERGQRIVAHLERDIARLETRTIVFRRERSRWVLGTTDAVKMYTRCPAVLEAARRAVRGKPVTAAEYCNERTEHAANSLRTRIRRAARWLEDRGHVELAFAFSFLRVVDGRLVYDAPGSAAEILTD